LPEPTVVDAQWGLDFARLTGLDFVTSLQHGNI
jgi:hypothetical protein